MILRAILIILIFSLAQAKDFGVVGHTFEIKEEDILKVIERKLKETDLNKLNSELQERTKSYVEHPKAVEGISTSKERKVFYYDPTYVVPEDIKDQNGTVIHKSGKLVNPLEYIPLREILIFIDGDDKKQVEFAFSVKKEAKIILIKGSPLKLQREYKTWIYFDQAGVITKKLGIKEVPAIVEQENLLLKITVEVVK